MAVEEGDFWHRDPSVFGVEVGANVCEFTGSKCENDEGGDPGHRGLRGVMPQRLFGRSTERVDGWQEGKIYPYFLSVLLPP